MNNLVRSNSNSDNSIDSGLTKYIENEKLTKTPRKTFIRGSEWVLLAFLDRFHNSVICLNRQAIQIRLLLQTLKFE